MKIELTQITKRIGVRSLKPKGVQRLKEKIAEVGYLPEKPVIITPDGSEEAYILIDGGHRVAALEKLGIDTVEAYLDDTLITEAMRLRRARLANEVSETVVKTTFVDDAELVWRLADEGMTQTEIGAVLGWGRSKVADYSVLKKISKEVWEIVVASIEVFATTEEKSGATPLVAFATFSEGLLRPILPLTSDQQLELVTELAAEKIKIKKFKELAIAYRSRNDMYDYTLIQLQGLPQEFIDQATEEIYSGAYDKDWQTENRPKLSKLIASILEEWEQKSGVQLIHGDFNEKVKLIEDNSIDFILTDPPYNISSSSKITKQGGKIVNAEFGGNDQWDTEDLGVFKTRLDNWVEEWSRILRPGGGIISFCDKALVSDLWNMFIDNGLVPKNIIVWEKDNPSPAGKGRRNLISATEFMVWGVKPGSEYTFNDSNEWNKTNVINSPLCAGNERLKDKSKNTLHPTQKPLRILLPLIEVFSNRGDVIFDGFMGVGSTGKAAKQLNRKFTGIEINESYFLSTQRELGE